MNKIKTRINKETNYIYHMLTVAKCGYDNAYGNKYQSYHNQEDLALLKKYEDFITVRGGEHCGALYYCLVIFPARGQFSAYQYYSELIKVFQDKKSSSELLDTNCILEYYSAYEDIIIDIATVMMNNYEIYCTNIWPDSNAIIQKYALSLDKMFGESDFTDKAESMVGQKLNSTEFYVTLCNSLYCGPEAIDIDHNQDVFGIDRSLEDAFFFIGHEYIIYLLKQALAESSAFKTLSVWGLTEGLADFYMKLIMGTLRFTDENQKYVDFYMDLYETNNQLTALELYSAAYKTYIE